MSLFHTPRWSPSQSVSTPTSSSSGSLPRTPSDETLNPLRQPPLAQRVPPKASSSLAAFAAQTNMLGSRPVALLPQIPRPLAESQLPLASSSASTSKNTSVGTSSVHQLDHPFAPLPRPTPSVLRETASSPGLCTPSTGSMVLKMSSASNVPPPHNTTNPAHQERVNLPGTPKATASANVGLGLNTSGLPVGPSRKRRKRSTPEQIEVLERHFAANDRPTSTARESIAKELDMTARQVQIWMQNRRQTRKKRLLEEAGKEYRPSSPSALLAGHPSSDSVGSILSSEMDDLPFDTLYGARRVVNNKENRPLHPLRPTTSAPMITTSIPESEPLLATPDVGRSIRRIPSVATRPVRTIASVAHPIAASASTTSALPSTEASDRSHPLPTMLLDKCVQSRELPFAHQPRSRPSTENNTLASDRLPIMGWRDEPAPSTSARDVWQHMMSDPPSGGLLELHEDDDDYDRSSDAEISRPGKLRRTSSSTTTSSSSSSKSTSVKNRRPTSKTPALPAHLEAAARPFRRSASLDCTASRSTFVSLKRSRSSLKVELAAEDVRRVRRSTSSESATRQTVAKDVARGAAKEAKAEKVPDATDVECARLLLGLLGGA